MPQLIVAVVAALASYGAAAGAVAAGWAAAGSLTATLIGAAAGLIVATAGNYLVASLTAAKQPSVQSDGQERKQAIRSAIAPRRVVYGRAMISGPVVFINNTGPLKENINMVICLAGHQLTECESVKIGEHWINYPEDLDGTNTVAVGPLAGRALIVFVDGTQTTALAGLVADSDGEWTEDHKLLGISYLYVRLAYGQDQSAFPSGIPNVAAVVKGKPVFDPRSDTTAYSDNPALCIRDYLVSDFGMNADETDEIDDPFFEAAANICDELVVWNGLGSTQKRYTCNGTFTLDEKPIDIVEKMMTSCVGVLTYIQGRYRLHAGAYDVPVYSIGIGDFAGELQIQTKPPRRERFNAVRGTFFDPAREWVAAEFPQVIVGSFETEDGERIYQDVELPYTIDVYEAQRLARQRLLRSRDSLTFRAPLKYSQFRLTAWMTVSVTVPDLGWNAKVFRVTEWKFDPVSGLIEATFLEDGPSLYAWTNLDASPPPPMPDTNMVSPLDIPAPGLPTLTPTTKLAADGTVMEALQVSWVAAAHTFVTSYEVQWKVSTDTEWSAAEIATPATLYVIAPVVAGAGYHVRVRARAGLAVSAWSATGSGTATGDTVAPAAPTSLVAVGAVLSISLGWNLPGDVDFAAVEIYENTANDEGTRYFLAETRTSGYLRRELAGGATRYYWVRARDRSGNVSGFVGPVSATARNVESGDIATAAVTAASHVTSTTTKTVAKPAAGVNITPVLTTTMLVGFDGTVRVEHSITRITYAGAPDDGGDGMGGR